MKFTEIYLFNVIEKNKEIVLFELRDFCSIGCGLLMEFFLEKIGENWTRSRVKSTTSLHSLIVSSYFRVSLKLIVFHHHR